MVLLRCAGAVAAFVVVVVGPAGGRVLTQQDLKRLRRLRLGAQADVVLVLVGVRRVPMTSDGPASSAGPRKLPCSPGCSSAVCTAYPVGTWQPGGSKECRHALFARKLTSGSCEQHRPAMISFPPAPASCCPPVPHS